MITVERLRKSFGSLVAVDDVSFTIRSGEIFGLLGPNGAGKTTCINMICGVLKPDGGRIVIGGRDIWLDAKTVKRSLGVVPQEIAGRFVVSAVQITVLVTVGVIANRTVGVFIGDHPVQMWLVLLLFAAVAAPLGVALGARITDPDRAASVGVIVTMVMAALGGCWWPIEVVSKPLKIAALFVPTGWAMRALHGLISFGRDLGHVAPSLLALAGFGIVFTALAARSLRVE